ncbi:MAG: CARDB domain-containing protein [Candidatus Krumholzibacteria bacterium]|nr:CARDB domain-containing protein [Candidatus Krumholzibacteria bacterium]
MNDRPFVMTFDPVNTHWRPGELIRRGDTRPRATPSRVEKFTRPLTPTPPLAEQHPRYADLDPAADKRLSNYSVSGRIILLRTAAAGDMGADGVTVKAMDWNAGFNIELGSTTTDDAGYFNLDFVWYDLLIDLYPDLYIRVEASNNVSTVRPWGSAFPYSFESDVDYNVTNNDIDVGELQVGLHSGAFAIHSSLVRTARFLDSHAGVSLPHIWANWPYGDEGAFYSRDLDQLFFARDRTWDEWVHAHEYGHFFSSRTAGLPTNPPNPEGQYCNDGDHCDAIPMDDCSHCIWCPEYDEVAWSEGVSNWIGDAMTREWLDLYEGPPAGMYLDGETAGICVANGPYEDAYLTEGFLALLLHDIDDGDQDDDPAGQYFWDQLTLGYDEILTVMVNDMAGDLSPRNFIYSFLARYPQYRTDFWETAANCGYRGIDNGNPQTPTLSSTHLVGVASPDDTIEITWAWGTDDLSGIQGYSHALSFDAPEAPRTDQVLMGDRTNFVSGILEPGTYYFTLRAFDREGNYDVTYETYGPMILREAELADVGPLTPAGWDLPVLPRGTADVTSNYAPAPTGLLNQTTYWNLGIINSGETAISTTFNTALKVDGRSVGSYSVSGLGAGSSSLRTNRGPVTIAGGRHTFTGHADYSGRVPEVVETNNHFGWQWLWNPTVFYSSPELTRPSPPLMDGGWDGITSGNIWYNCDGLRFITSPSTDLVSAVYIVPDHANDDYDCRLHELATNATTGFTFNLGYSSRPERYLDAVLVNADNAPAAGYDVGVLNEQGEIDAGYKARVLYATELALNVTVADGMPANQQMRLYKFHLDATTDGHKTIELRADPSWLSSDYHIAWYDETMSTATILDYQAVAVEDNDGVAMMHIDAAAGLHTLAVWHDPGFGAAVARDYTLQIRNRRADMATYMQSNWDAPLVPRPAADATYATAHLPSSLPGDVTSTYLNYSYINVSPGQSTEFGTSVSIDGRMIDDEWQNMTGNGYPFSIRRTAAHYVPGGRHAFTMHIDPGVDLDEDYLENNMYGTQYVWQPVPLAMDVRDNREDPLAPTAGWADITVVDQLWYNADGVRTPTFATSGLNGFWGAVAIIPGAESDVDLRLHKVSGGLNDGFGEALASSVWPEAETEFVLVNLHGTSYRVFDAGVVNASTPMGDDYFIVATESSHLGTTPTGDQGPFTMGNDDIVRLHEVALTAGDTYTVTLESDEATCDLGISFYGKNAPYYGKSDVYDDASSGAAIAFAAPAGADEVLTFAVETSGNYCLAVWKRGWSDASQTVDYVLNMNLEAATAVEDALPRITRLVGAHPNPFNPMTQVVFDLAAKERVTLDVFDLRGQRVRTLFEGDVEAGRHKRAWDGRDDGGKRMASGSYLVRMRAGARTEMTKVALLK